MLVIHTIREPYYVHLHDLFLTNSHQWRLVLGSFDSTRLNCVHGDSDSQQFSDLVFNVLFEFHLIRN